MAVSQFLQFLREQPFARRDREIGVRQPLQSFFPQALADRIADQERARERSASYGRAQHHAQMRPRVEAQTAKDKSSAGHVKPVWFVICSDSSVASFRSGCLGCGIAGGLSSNGWPGARSV